VVEPHIPPHIHRAYHSFCQAIHLRDNCPTTTGGCGPLMDLPSHLKHILRSLPGINALLVTTSLSFPAPADGTAIAGPNETFEMPSTKSEALMKRRGLSMTPAASSRWPKEINRSRVPVVGRHDAMLFRSSGTGRFWISSYCWVIRGSSLFRSIPERSTISIKTSSAICRTSLVRCRELRNARKDLI